MFAAAGFGVVAAGGALLVLPGPGVLLIAVGLAMLALEFTWAEKVLLRTVRTIERARPTGRQGGLVRRTLPSIALALVALALLVAVLVWDIPALPV